MNERQREQQLAEKNIFNDNSMRYKTTNRIYQTHLSSLVGLFLEGLRQSWTIANAHHMVYGNGYTYIYIYIYTSCCASK